MCPQAALPEVTGIRFFHELTVVEFLPVLSVPLPSWGVGLYDRANLPTSSLPNLLSAYLLYLL